MARNYGLFSANGLSAPSALLLVIAQFSFLPLSLNLSLIERRKAFFSDMQLILQLDPLIILSRLRRRPHLSVWIRRLCLLCTYVLGDDANSFLWALTSARRINASTKRGELESELL